MKKFIQICASANDLFGLDSDGMVYHYNFNTKSWMRLDCEKRDGTRATEDLTNGRVEAEPAARQYA